jgi:fructokinase
MPSIAGIGLVALDVVIDEQTGQEAGEWAGGSCGNVMAILAYFGWAARPVARLDGGEPSRRICNDLTRWGVETDWLTLSPHARAPIYVERLSYDQNGHALHRFERYCPACGQHLPRYRPVTQDALRPLLAAIGERDVLYIDRPSAGAVLAAEHAREHGTFVYFEPSARGDRRQLARVTAAANIVKYSADRLSAEDRSVIASANPALEIETRGASGLRYRVRGTSWQALQAPTTAIRDTAGAGDWMTAGLLQHLFMGRKTRRDLRQPAVGLVAAQALAAFSCGYVGSRGAMESHTPREALAMAKDLIDGDRHTARQRRVPRVHAATAFTCGDCA